MRSLTTRLGLFALFGLALLTASINVEATQRGYRLGKEYHKAADLRRLIIFRRACCRQMLRTHSLAQVLKHLNLGDKEPYPMIAAPELAPAVALGAPR